MKSAKKTGKKPAKAKKAVAPAKAIKATAKAKPAKMDLKAKKAVKPAPVLPKEKKKAPPVQAAKPTAVKSKPTPVEKPVSAKVEKTGALKNEDRISKKESPTIEVVPSASAHEEPVLTDAEGRRYCRVKDCDQIAAVDSYCRYHYLLLWKNIQVRKKILSEGKLERYIEELTARYPDKYLDMLRKDMRSEKDFLSAIQELELDESGNETEFEEESFIDEVRGMSSESQIRDEDEAF